MPRMLLYGSQSNRIGGIQVVSCLCYPLGQGKMSQCGSSDASSIIYAGQVAHVLPPISSTRGIFS